MIDVNLVFPPNMRGSKPKTIMAHVVDGPYTYFVEITVTAWEPCSNTPVLGADPSGYIPQELLDTLFKVTLVSEEALWWHEYYKTRRADQERLGPERLSIADATFAEEAVI